MKILITGHKGMLGTAVKAQLDEIGVKLEKFDYLGSYKEWLLAFDNLKAGMFDMILHIGSMVDSNLPETDDPNRLWQMNYLATEWLGRLARDRSAKFLFISSYAAMDPTTPYGWSKRVAEDMLRLILPERSLCILRPLSLWSWDEAGKREPSVVYKIMSRQLPFVAKDCVRDFLYVKDAAKAISTLVNDWSAGTFELGLGEPIDLETFVRSIYKHLDDSFEMPPIVDHRLSGTRLVADPDRLPPGWTPTYGSVLRGDNPYMVALAMKELEHAKMHGDTGE